MDIRKVKKLIELIDETSVMEIEIKEGEESLRISRGSPQMAPTSPQIVVQQPDTATHAVPSTIAKDTTHVDTNTVSNNTSQEYIVKSPMVGTMYVSQTPEADPFVSVGDHVNKGDTICIIEAMKMFNKIEADATGTIKSRLVGNGDAVEYDQPLFIIEKD